jgi:hypothetical protein
MAAQNTSVPGQGSTVVERVLGKGFKVVARTLRRAPSCVSTFNRARGHFVEDSRPNSHLTPQCFTNRTRGSEQLAAPWKDFRKFDGGEM